MNDICGVPSAAATSNVPPASRLNSPVLAGSMSHVTARDPATCNVPAFEITSTLLVPLMVQLAPASKVSVPKPEKPQTWPASVTLPEPVDASEMGPVPPANSVVFGGEGAQASTEPLNTAVGSATTRLPVPKNRTASMPPEM